MKCQKNPSYIKIRLPYGNHRCTGRSCAFHFGFIHCDTAATLYDRLVLLLMAALGLSNKLRRNLQGGNIIEVNTKKAEYIHTKQKLSVPTADAPVEPTMRSAARLRLHPLNRSVKSE